MTRTALLVGGSGPTGPLVADGLAARGHDVTLLHRGTHELPETARYEHLHADPHFRDSLAAALGGRTFDVVVAAYGRLRLIADVVAGRCEQVIAVSGAPVYVGYHEPGRRFPRGLPICVDEDAADDGRAAAGQESAGETFARKIRDAERHLLALHRHGAFSASIFRYPSIYGPRQVYPREWSVVRRVLDGRRHIILPDAGLSIMTRCAAANAAAFVLAAVDRPDAAAGEIFNVADCDQYSLRQWVDLAASAAGGSLEIVSMPYELAGPGRALFPIPHTEHVLLGITKALSRLGYVEPVPAAEALRSTVRWYLDHPPDAQQAGALVDDFDYAQEDRVIATWRRMAAELTARQQPARTAAHPYAHPKLADVRDHRDR